MRDHNKLRAFQLADEVTVFIYKMTIQFPREEIFGLTSQMRRAAVSVSSNIVEGSARESEREYLRFLEIAFGSLRELKYQFGLACRLGYIKEQMNAEGTIKIEEAEKVIAALLRYIRKH
jgi:four helix bundle protein